MEERLKAKVKEAERIKSALFQNFEMENMKQIKLYDADFDDREIILNNRTLNERAEAEALKETGSSEEFITGQDHFDHNDKENVRNFFTYTYQVKALLGVGGFSVVLLVKNMIK